MEVEGAIMEGKSSWISLKEDEEEIKRLNRKRGERRDCQ